MTIPQGSGKLLNAGWADNANPVAKRYAVCYSTGDGSASDETWADSYIRLKISHVESISHHSARHTTWGHLPNTAGTALTDKKMTLDLTGSLIPSMTNIKVTHMLDARCYPIPIRICILA